MTGFTPGEPPRPNPLRAPRHAAHRPPAAARDAGQRAGREAGGRLFVLKGGPAALRGRSQPRRRKRLPAPPRTPQARASACAASGPRSGPGSDAPVAGLPRRPRPKAGGLRTCTRVPRPVILSSPRSPPPSPTSPTPGPPFGWAPPRPTPCPLIPGTRRHLPTAQGSHFDTGRAPGSHLTRRNGAGQPFVHEMPLLAACFQPPPAPPRRIFAPDDARKLPRPSPKGREPRPPVGSAPRPGPTRRGLAASAAPLRAPVASLQRVSARARRDTHSQHSRIPGSNGRCRKRRIIARPERRSGGRPQPAPTGASPLPATPHALPTLPPYTLWRCSNMHRTIAHFRRARPSRRFVLPSRRRRHARRIYSPS
jgi:hypothetical protein